MITLTINLHEREDFTNEDGEMQIASQAALDRAVSALKYDGFSLVSAVVSNDIQVGNADISLVSENTAETPTLVVNWVEEEDDSLSWRRKISFSYNGYHFKNTTLSYGPYDGYELSGIDDEGQDILEDFWLDSEFLTQLDCLSAEKQYEMYHIKRD